MLDLSFLAFLEYVGVLVFVFSTYIGAIRKRKASAADSLGIANLDLLPGLRTVLVVKEWNFGTGIPNNAKF